MAIEMVCACGQRLKIRDEFAGRRLKCPGCQAILVAPNNVEAVAPEVPPIAPDYEPPGAMVRALYGNTEASNPGGLRVEYLKHARSFPFWPTLWAASIPACAVLWLLAHNKDAWLLLVLPFAVNGFYWFRVTMALRHGCVNAAVVVSTQPYLVAVVADLDSSGQSPWWVVKIVRQPLATMTGGPPVVGTRLATIATYSGSTLSALKSHWDNFYPVVVNCATSDDRAIRRILASIPREEWDMLEAGLQQVPTPRKPGRYRINPGAA